MTVLQALTSHYERLREEGRAAPAGYSMERISYAVVLSRAGEAVDVASLLDTSGSKPRPSLRAAPQPPSGRVAIAPNFLWDKTAYAFGVKRAPGAAQCAPAPREHAAFKAFHEDMLAGTCDEGLLALLSFLRNWKPEHYDGLRYSEPMLDENVVFRLDGDRQFLHDREAAKAIWNDRPKPENLVEGWCLVSGKREPLARVHPKVKGVAGAHTSGASIVAFNKENNAFESFGKKQGANAPISGQAAYAYTFALNSLLTYDSRRRIRIGGTTAVFWAETPRAEEIVAACLEPPDDDSENAQLRDVMENLRRGVPVEKADPDLDPRSRYYILGLAPNAARISVRFWHTGTLGEFGKRLREHWGDLRIDPEPAKRFPAARDLVNETAVVVKRQGRREKKFDTVPPRLTGETLQTILTGSRYPRTLLTAVVMRVRADCEIGAMRAAVLRACLVRDLRIAGRLPKEEYIVSLDRDESNPAYRLGRLFAVMEYAQRAAINPTATVRDRYYGAASAGPAAVFPMILRTTSHHLASLRKGRGADWVKNPEKAAGWCDREIGEILGGIGGRFPATLSIEDQGRFAIGYYHQRFTKRADAPEDAAQPAEDDTTDNEE